MAIAVGNLYEVRVYTYTPTQVGVNTRHYDTISVGVGGPPTEKEFADALDATLRALYPAVMATTSNYYGLTVQKIRPLPKLIAVVSTLGDTAGTVAGDRLPTFTAGVLRFKTALAGPSFRGRTFLPFPAEASNDVDSTPVAAYRTSANLIADVFKTQVVVTVGATTATFNPVIFSRLLDASQPIIEGAIVFRWGLIHKRGPFGQTNLGPPL